MDVTTLKNYDSQKQKHDGFCSHFPTCNLLLKKLENISCLVGGGTANFLNKLDVDPLLITSPTSFKKVVLSLDSIQTTQNHHACFDELPKDNQLKTNMANVC